MSIDVKDALKIADVAFDALQVIQALTGVGGDKAADALAKIDRIVSAIHDGAAGKTSPEIVASDIAALAHSLELNDDAAMRRLKARFKQE